MALRDRAAYRIESDEEYVLILLAYNDDVQYHIFDPNTQEEIYRGFAGVDEDDLKYVAESVLETIEIEAYNMDALDADDVWKKLVIPNEVERDRAVELYGPDQRLSGYVRASLSLDHPGVHYELYDPDLTLMVAEDLDFVYSVDSAVDMVKAEKHCDLHQEINYREFDDEILKNAAGKASGIQQENVKPTAAMKLDALKKDLHEQEAEHVPDEVQDQSADRSFYINDILTNDPAFMYIEGYENDPRETVEFCFETKDVQQQPHQIDVYQGPIEEGFVEIYEDGAPVYTGYRESSPHYPLEDAKSYLIEKYEGMEFVMVDAPAERKAPFYEPHPADFGQVDLPGDLAASVEQIAKVGFGFDDNWAGVPDVTKERLKDTVRNTLQTAVGFGYDFKMFYQDPRLKEKRDAFYDLVKGTFASQQHEILRKSLADQGFVYGRVDNNDPSRGPLTSHLMLPLERLHQNEIDLRLDEQKKILWAADQCGFHLDGSPRKVLDRIAGIEADLKAPAPGKQHDDGR